MVSVSVGAYRCSICKWEAAADSGPKIECSSLPSFLVSQAERSQFGVDPEEVLNFYSR